MKTKIRAVFYSPCTDCEKGLFHSLEILKLPLDEKVKNLKEKIRNSYNYLVNTEKIELDDETIIFIAPEWYFKSESVFDPMSDYTYDEMKTTFLDLKEFSKPYTSLLIIPGSFYYKGPPPKSDSNQRNIYVYNCTAPIFEGKILSVIHKIFDGVDIPRVMRKFVTWGMYQGIKVRYMPYTDEEQYLLIKMANENYQVYNKKICKDFKLGNIDNYGVFSVNKLKYGLEICQDHQQKKLKNNIEDETVDIQIAVAAGLNAAPDAIVLKKGGYFFICDGSSTGHHIIEPLFDDNDECDNFKQIATSSTNGNLTYFRLFKNGQLYEIDQDEEKYNSDTDVMIYDKSIEIKKPEKINTTLKEFTEFL